MNNDIICIRDYCFEYLEHTADVKIRGYGRNLKKAFYSGAAGMLNHIYDLDKVESKEKRYEIEAKGDYAVDVLYEWLEKLLEALYVEKIAFGYFKIKNLRRVKDEEGNKYWYLRGYAEGESYSLKKHGFKKEVKAVTMHDMKIGKLGRAKYYVEFIVDV